MELTPAAGLSGVHLTRPMASPCDEAWFRCPSCRTNLPRLPWVLDLLAQVNGVAHDGQPTSIGLGEQQEVSRDRSKTFRLLQPNAR